MKVNITSRHFEIRQDLENFINDNSELLNKHFANSIEKIDVILDYHRNEKLSKISEFIVHAYKCEFVSKESSDDFEKSVTECFDKIKIQITKHKEKIQLHH